MAVELFCAKSTLYRVADEIDRGLDRKLLHAHASALKLHCSEMAGRVVDKALQRLRAGRSSLEEIAAEVGYSDAVTLRTLLRRKTGRGLRELRR